MSQSLKQKCDLAGQGHLLQLWSHLSTAEQQSLTAQIDNLDLDRVNDIYHKAVTAEKKIQTSENAGHGEPISPLPEDAFTSIVGDLDKEKAWRTLGLKAIAEGEVGVLLMAGGQGTRLGSTAPKGCYDIGLPSHKTLFQLQAERIARLQTLAAQAHGRPIGSVNIPWYIMTSGPTRHHTETFFLENSFFGLDPSDVIFFEQGTLPCLTMDGKIIMDAPSRIAVAPDGNGGVYAALRNPISSSNPTATALTDLQRRKVLYIHAYGVDNCLVRVADPVFIGYGISKSADCAVKVVRKTLPSEAVGVVALRGDKYSVVEYSEISQQQAERRDKSGELAFRAANIVNHFYATKFLNSIQLFEDQLAFHIARKKIPYVDLHSTQLIKPSKPNGMKLELFVFDVFPFAKNFAVLEVDRTEEFSPLKNAPGTGTDDPQTSRKDILAQYRRFLQKAGAEVNSDIEIELSPLFTYAGEGLNSVSGKRFVKSGIVNNVEDIQSLVQ